MVSAQDADKHLPPEIQNPTGPWRLFRIIIGIALLAVGFVGLFLPFLPGLLLLFLGLVLLLGKEGAVKLVNRWKMRFKRLFGRTDASDVKKH